MKELLGSRPRRRCGHRRCFFCRVSAGLERLDRSDSADLADGSDCESSEDLPVLVQRRKTSRERGRKLYKPRRRAAATWYATHTVDREPSPVASKEPTEEASKVKAVESYVSMVSPGELEPYTSAAARRGMRKTLKDSEVQGGDGIPGPLQLPGESRSAGRLSITLDPHSHKAIKGFHGIPVLKRCWPVKELPAAKVGGPDPIQGPVHVV